MNQNQYFKNSYSFENFLKNINYKYLNICSINSRSISSINKFSKFKTFLAKLPRLPDILAIQETWFDKKCTQLYTIPHYNSVHCCRIYGYGGTSVYISKKLMYTVNICQSQDYVDLIQLRLNNYNIKGKPLEFMTFYRSQKCKVEKFLEILDSKIRIFANNSAVIVGDSNVDLFDCTQADDITNLFQCYGLKSCHMLITRPSSGSCIDHIFSNIDEKLSIDSVECKLSDHNFLCCKLKSEYDQYVYTEKIKYYCDYETVKEYLNQNLVNIPLDNNPSEITSNLINTINDAISISTTVSRQNKSIKNDIAPWINKNLWSLMESKKKLLKMRRKNRNDATINDRLRRISRIIKISTKENMNLYYENNLLKFGGDIKSCWRFLNNAMGRSNGKPVNIVDSDGNFVDNNQIKATIFNEYFVNVVESLKQGIETHSDDNCNSLRTLQQHNKRFYFREVALNKLENTIMSLNKTKCPGHDNISSTLIMECCTILSPFLVRIFNTMINTSIYPDLLKLHKVIPIPKSSNSKTVEQFRPIALLSIIDKIFEKLIHFQLLDFFEQESLLSKNQFGYVKGSGTDEAVIDVINTICEGLDSGFNGVAGLFFDFSKAFDLVDHKILLEKLKFYGIFGNELKLIKSFLSDRRQYVEIGEDKSSVLSISCGVPQGSVLGPLLFMVYLNDINNLGLWGKIVMFADDVSVFYPYKYDLSLKTKMERDL